MTKMQTSDVSRHREGQFNQLYLDQHLKPQWGWRTYFSIVFFVVLYSLVFIDLEIDLADLATNSGRYLIDVFLRMIPPDFSDFQTLFVSMIETVEIALMGTLLAISLSIPLSILSAKNLTPNPFTYSVCKTITIFFRSLPEFIVAMILVIAIGFGPMPGILALGLHTMGFLAKFYAESIEHIDMSPVTSLEMMGASKSQAFVFGVIPQIMPSFIGNNFYILDRNIRMATMLGIVGAGGIGYELQSSFRMFEYERVSAIIIIIFVTIYILDMISSFIRQRLL